MWGGQEKLTYHILIHLVANLEIGRKGVDHEIASQLEQQRPGVLVIEQRFVVTTKDRLSDIFFLDLDMELGILACFLLGRETDERRND